MSSHHIVRENQEPALLILNAQAISFEKIQELLEWMPTVVVFHTAVNTVLSWGIKVDVVIVPYSDTDAWRAKLIDQAPLKLISFNPQDDPILTAFYFLNASKATGVNVLLGDKADLLKLETFARLDVEAYVDNVRWCLARSGQIEKWYPAGARLFVFPDSTIEKLAQFSSGQLNVNHDGIVALKAGQPFWLGEELF
jgi:hypothetical protein